MYEARKSGESELQSVKRARWQGVSRFASRATTPPPLLCNIAESFHFKYAHGGIDGSV
jgi:hypothetical protein